MATGIIDSSTLTEIADAIRTKTGTTDTFEPSGMAAAISSISSKHNLYRAWINDDTVYLRDENVTSLRDGILAYRGSLKSVSFPLVTSVGSQAFYNCVILETADLPRAETIGSHAFMNTDITYIDLPMASSIGSSTFSNTNLETLILRGSVVCSIGSLAFRNTKIENGSGYIYVPEALISAYQSDESWSTYANQLRSIEAYGV